MQYRSTIDFKGLTDAQYLAVLRATGVTLRCDEHILREQIDHAVELFIRRHGEQQGGKPAEVRTKLERIARWSTQLISELGILRNDPETVPVDLATAFHPSRPWHSLEKDVRSIVALRDAAEKSAKRVRGDTFVHRGDVAFSCLIEELAIAFLVCYQRRPHLSGMDRVGPFWRFCNSIFTATRSNLSEIVLSTDTTIHRALDPIHSSMRSVLRLITKRWSAEASGEGAGASALLLLELIREKEPEQKEAKSVTR